METQSLDELEQYFLNLLSHIYLWSERLEKYIIDEKEYLSRNIKKWDGISWLSNLSFQTIIRKYDKITPDLLNELKKDKLEEFKKISSHASLIFAKSRDELLLSLTEEIFPSITWSSLFLSAMSLFEYFLINILEFISTKNKLNLQLNELSRNNRIYKEFKHYCLKVLELECDFSTKSWKNIINHQKVRNIIVHNNGYLDDDKRIKEIAEIINSSSTSLLLRDNRIIINKKYLDEVIFNIQHWIEEFFSKLL